MNRKLLPAVVALGIALITSLGVADEADSGRPPVPDRFRFDGVTYLLPVEFPSRDDILRALPPGSPEEIIEDIQCKLLSYDQASPRLFPHAGFCSILSTRYECTVQTDQRTAVFWMDHDYLVKVE
jgi:hypothetical protein